MVLISDYFKFNNNNLIIKLKEYINKNPCCSNISVKNNVCNHPKYQSDPLIFNVKDIDIDIIKNNYFNFLFKTFNKKSLDIVDNKCWVYLTLKNEKTKSIWHNHIIENNCINVSGLIYLTETKIGTEFKTKFLNFEIIPHINRWYIWDSSIIHRPKDMISGEDRIVIATSTILKK
jgi:hypothetical protein